MRRTIDTGTLIDLIAAGLPDYILNEIDREAIKDTEKLFNEVSKYEHIVNKKTFVPKKKFGYYKAFNNNRNEEKSPCKICEKLNKGTRYHPEATCWFKTKEDERKNNIKHVNNTEIEAVLNESDQKNE